MTRRGRAPTVNDLGALLCAARLIAWQRGDARRVDRAMELIDELMAAMRDVKAETDRVGLSWGPDETAPTGLRGVRRMADDHDSPAAWRAAAQAFQRLTRVHCDVKRALAGELRDLLET